jgi:hypothetical protein
MYKKLALLVLSCIVVIGILISLVIADGKNTSSASTIEYQSTSTSDSEDEVNSELAMLGKQVEMIRKENQEIKQILKSSKDTTADAESLERNTELHADDSERKDRYSRPPNLGDAEMDRMYGAQLDRALFDEEIDKLWRLETERLIAGNITNNAPEGTSLLSSECKSTFCRIELAFRDVDSRERFVLKSAMLPPWNTSAFFWVKDPEDTEVVFYFSREGQSLPSQVF